MIGPVEPGRGREGGLDLVAARVIKELDDEVDVGQQHAPAAVPLQTQRLERLPVHKKSDQRKKERGNREWKTGGRARQGIAAPTRTNKKKKNVRLGVVHRDQVEVGVPLVAHHLGNEGGRGLKRARSVVR